MLDYSVVCLSPVTRASNAFVCFFVSVSLADMDAQKIWERREGKQKRNKFRNSYLYTDTRYQLKVLPVVQ